MICPLPRAHRGCSLEALANEPRNETGFANRGKEAPVMARLAWLLVIVTALISGCATGAASMSDTRNEPARAQERPPEAGGGGY
jgi:hypothetical protein